jgi:DNA-binding NtrC family response regulator
MDILEIYKWPENVRQFINALEKSNGNRSQAIRPLKIPRHVLIYRLEKFDLYASKLMML